MDAKHFLSKILINAGICDYTTIPFVANLAFLFFFLAHKEATLLPGKESKKHNRQPSISSKLKKKPCRILDNVRNSTFRFLSISVHQNHPIHFI
jgi:hypothetical protein